jgi:ribosomal protein S18 acetylase RimI-like enzyme
MLELEFQTMTDAASMPKIVSMMRALYAEDEPAHAVDSDRFPRTIEHLLNEPGRGRIILFQENGFVRGYALLIPYWSNEFGGTLLFVDELFVAPEARRRGIARAFFQFLIVQRPFDAVAFALEVSPRNTRARSFYESIGFQRRRNVVMTLSTGSASDRGPARS